MSPANQPAVLITARQFDAAAVAWLRDQGCTVRQPALGGTDPAPDTLPALLADMDGWIVGSTDVDRQLMAAFPRLQVLARRGVGYEQIDTAAAKELGRIVTIAAGGNGPSVADHAVGMMLAVGKQLVVMTERMRRGDWSYGVGTELHEKTVGIIGLGRIGRLVARRLRGSTSRSWRMTSCRTMPTPRRTASATSTSRPCCAGATSSPCTRR